MSRLSTPQPVGSRTRVSPAARRSVSARKRHLPDRPAGAGVLDADPPCEPARRCRADGRRGHDRPTGDRYPHGVQLRLVGVFPVNRELARRGRLPNRLPVVVGVDGQQLARDDIPHRDGEQRLGLDGGQVFSGRQVHQRRDARAAGERLRRDGKLSADKSLGGAVSVEALGGVCPQAHRLVLLGQHHVHQPRVADGRVGQFHHGRACADDPRVQIGRGGQDGRVGGQGGEALSHLGGRVVGLADPHPRGEILGSARPALPGLAGGGVEISPVPAGPTVVDHHLAGPKHADRVGPVADDRPVVERLHSGPRRRTVPIGSDRRPPIGRTGRPSNSAPESAARTRAAV